jgi:periplasmic protein CpxP/Spy
MSSEINPSAPQPLTRHASRARRVLVGGILVLSGVIVGVGTTALSQDYGPRWSQGDGPRGSNDSPRGGHEHDGDFGGPAGRGGPGMHGGHFGGLSLTPGRIERMTNRLAWEVDASSEQKQKISAIITGVATDLDPLRQQFLDGRKAIAEALAAPTIDRGKLEALRAQHMQLADTASKRLIAAIADAGDVLTPAQRAELAKRIEERARWFRG